MKAKRFSGNILRKSKIDYLAKLKEKQVTDNKRIWNTTKLFLSNKVQSSEGINLTNENDSL